MCLVPGPSPAFEHCGPHDSLIPRVFAVLFGFLVLSDASGAYTGSCWCSLRGKEELSQGWLMSLSGDGTVRPTPPHPGQYPAAPGSGQGRENKGAAQTEPSAGAGSPLPALQTCLSIFSRKGSLCGAGPVAQQLSLHVLLWQPGVHLVWILGVDLCTTWQAMLW